MEEDKNNKPQKGYGKRPVWQWVLIYVIAAIIIYGLIYYIFIRNGSSSGGGNSGGVIGY